MKFYGFGIVYLPTGKKVRFPKGEKRYSPGELEVTDKAIADELIKLGYKYTGAIKEEAKPGRPKKSAKIAEEAEIEDGESK
jgi:hypothetical protein